MPWNIENYYIVDSKILCIEITTPLLEFLYTNIEDVKDTWVEMLGQFITDQPGVEMSWQMETRDDKALVKIQIAKPGEMESFSDLEARGAIDAVDALFDKKL
ncbi:MAG: hypothetical protein ACTSV2_03465 [Candidatus Thorarchaeota archaeon]